MVALYPFKAIEGGDLSLEKVRMVQCSRFAFLFEMPTHLFHLYYYYFQNAEYEVIDDSQEHWWKVKDQHGIIGYIPSNYVKPKETLGLDKYE